LDIKWHPDAEAEFDADIDWYDDREVGLGDRFEIEVLDHRSRPKLRRQRPMPRP
jgi:hypothetical protein